jgi:hypothetical protein
VIEIYLPEKTRVVSGTEPRECRGRAITNQCQLVPLSSGLKHIHMSGSGELLHYVGALNGVRLNYSTGTALVICQTLLQRIVTTPLHERSEHSVVA